MASSLIKQIRLNKLLAHTAILVVTAFGSNVVREAIDAGADASAEKPFDFDKFLNTVQELIAGHEQAAKGRFYDAPIANRSNHA